MVNQKEEICTDIGKAMGTFLRITSYGRPQGEVSKAVRAYFRNVISEMSKDKIIIISTHIVSDIEFISDQVLIMKKGKFILQGAAEDLVSEMKEMVWTCKIPGAEWLRFENTHNVAEFHHLGNVMEARVISPAKPWENAEKVSPTLEDLYLECFADEGNCPEDKTDISGNGRRKKV